MADSLEQKTIGGLHEHLLARLGDVPKDSAILDLGCGSGAWLARLAQSGFGRLTGVDQVLPLPEKFTAPRPVFLQSDLEQPGEALASLHGTCDVITAIEVVEHVANQGNFWDLVAALLRPQGRALVTTPNVHSLPSRLRWLISGSLRHFDEHSDPTHVAPVFLPLLPRVLEPRDLEIVAMWSYPSRGYLAMRPALNALFTALAFADRCPGDTLCLWLRKKGAQ